MRPIPKNQLDPKIKNVWRISDAISLTIIYLCCVIAWPIVALAAPEEAWWAWIVTGVLTAIWVVCLIIWLIILPPIRWMRWRYEVGENELDIARGIVWLVGERPDERCRVTEATTEVVLLEIG